MGFGIITVMVLNSYIAGEGIDALLLLFLIGYDTIINDYGVL